MPGFNQRGPTNKGPMTGGMRGFCAGSEDFRGAGSRGQGLGRRGCRSGGRNFVSAKADMPRQTSPVSESETLKERARFLEDELAAVKRELDRLAD